MTPFHLPVLFGPARFDVPKTDTGFLHGQSKGKGEFGPIVDLNLANGKREGVSHRSQEVETGAVILARIQAQDAIARAVIQGRVLKTFLAGDFHFLDINLHTVAQLLRIGCRGRQGQVLQSPIRLFRPLQQRLIVDAWTPK